MGLTRSLGEASGSRRLFFAESIFTQRHGEKERSSLADRVFFAPLCLSGRKRGLPQSCQDPKQDRWRIRRQGFLSALCASAREKSTFTQRHRGHREQLSFPAGAVFFGHFRLPVFSVSSVPLCESSGDLIRSGYRCLLFPYFAPLREPLLCA